jgi:hypothetical protein
MGERLLNVHVFACLTSPNTHKSMPVVWGDDYNGIDVFIIEKLAIIHVCGDFLISIPEVSGLKVQELCVNITECDYANARHFTEDIEVLLAFFAKTYDSNSNVII